MGQDYSYKRVSTMKDEHDEHDQEKHTFRGVDYVRFECVEPKWFYEKGLQFDHAMCVALDAGKFKFRPPTHIPCYRMPNHLDTVCTKVSIIPMDKTCGHCIYYHESTLIMYCKVRMPLIFTRDQISRIFSPSDPNRFDLHTHKRGTNTRFNEVIIISIRDNPSFSQQDLLRLHKPHCLLLVLDCPQSLFFHFPIRQ